MTNKKFLFRDKLEEARASYAKFILAENTLRKELEQIRQILPEGKHVRSYEEHTIDIRGRDDFDIPEWIFLDSTIMAAFRSELHKALEEAAIYQEYLQELYEDEDEE